jgi:hypothetical protein
LIAETTDSVIEAAQRHGRRGGTCPALMFPDFLYLYDTVLTVDRRKAGKGWETGFCLSPKPFGSPSPGFGCLFFAILGGRRGFK